MSAAKEMKFFNSLVSLTVFFFCAGRSSGARDSDY